MPPKHPNFMGRLLEIAERFRQKGATSAETAVSLDELVDRSEFEHTLIRGPGGLGVFVEVDGKYYLSEEGFQQAKGHLALREHVRDMMSAFPPPPLKRVMRHTASVPKGFLRYYVLQLLKERPMSGSEIMDQIDKQTRGRWRPSPGSVYPLLAWLQEKGYTEGVPREVGGVLKRYVLTEEGAKFSEGQSKLQEELRRRMEFFAPPFLGGFWLGPHSERLIVIRSAAVRLARAIFDLRLVQKEGLADGVVNKVAMHLNTAAQRIEEIGTNLKRQNEIAEAD